MPLSYWFPGWGHWRLGRPVQGAVILGLFGFFLGDAGWHAGTLWESLAHTVQKLSVASIPYTLRALDFLVSTLFVLGILVALVLYSGFSCRRIQETESLA